MNRFLAISIGAVLGANTRYYLGSFFDRKFATIFPFGTLIINCTGCLIIGFFLIFTTERIALAPTWRYLIAVGFLGSYTTFSTFSYESWRLASTGSWLLAIGNIVLSVFGGFMGVLIGSQLARLL